jgi:hypothetical protein
VYLHTKQALFVLLSMTTIGCTPLGDQGPGPFPAELPPKLIQRDGFKVWDNPRAFGPVPNELISTGEKVCSTMSEGIEFLGGGYYCVKKSN